MRKIAGRNAPLVLGLVCVSLFGGIAGCGLQSPDIDRDYVNSIPDKESYLLDKLSKRFENPDVHCELGRYYHSEGKWAKAQYHFDVALGFDPAHRATQAAYVKMLLDKGDRSEADQRVQRYQKQLLNAPLEMINLATALGKENLDTYALSCFNKALQIAPYSYEANKQMGLYYLTRKNDERAREFLTKSFELNPNQPEVAGALGRLGVVVEVPVKYQAQTTAETPAKVQKQPGT
jgi:tetratricopeptide (TPR) repeat protein